MNVGSSHIYSRRAMHMFGFQGTMLEVIITFIIGGVGLWILQAKKGLAISLLGAFLGFVGFFAFLGALASLIGWTPPVWATPVWGGILLIIVSAGLFRAKGVLASVIGIVGVVLGIGSLLAAMNPVYSEPLFTTADAIATSGYNALTGVFSSGIAYWS